MNTEDEKTLERLTTPKLPDLDTSQYKYRHSRFKNWSEKTNPVNGPCPCGKKNKEGKAKKFKKCCGRVVVPVEKEPELIISEEPKNEE